MPELKEKIEATICVVDDDASLNRSLSALLVEAGYTILSFSSAAEFIAHAPLHSVDLVISDISMPGPSGYDLCVFVRSQDQGVHVPVILITGVDGGSEKTKGLELGADDFIQKPFRIEEILAKIRSLLKWRAKQRETLQKLNSVQVENTNLTDQLKDQFDKTISLERLRQFFSPRIAEILASGDPQAFLKCHRQEVTVFFIDLRRFTAFAETAEPEEVLGTLEEYYSTVGNLCLEHGGTLGHLAGDGIMIFFNDPEPVPDHRKVALRMALKVRERLGEHKKKWNHKDYDLDFGIGLAEGFATIGGIGFEQFWQYSVIGTVTNLAARLCKEADNGQIVVSHRFLSVIQEHFQAEPIGELEVKGMSKSIAAFNVIAEIKERNSSERAS